MSAPYSNAFIAQLIEQEAQGRSGYEQSALLNSARIIRSFPDPITDPARQLKGVRGVGAGTIRRVKEILERGTLTVAPPASPKPLPLAQNTVPSELEGVSGVNSPFEVIGASEDYSPPCPLLQVKFIGAVKCRQLNQMGITTIPALREAVRENPTLLQNNQKVALQYYEDLLERVPREEVAIIGDLVLEQAEDLGMTGAITGSYRRGKETSGDVDVILTGPQNKLATLVKTLKEQGLILYDFSHGAVKYMGLAQLPNLPARSLDIRYVPPNTFGSALLFSTGSADLNIQMRRRAIEQGLTLSEYGLYRADTGEALPANDEVSIFRALGLEYLPPEQRG